MGRLFETVCTPGYRGGRVGVSGLALSYDLLHAHLDERAHSVYTKAAQAAVRKSLEATPRFFKSSGANTPISMTLSAIPTLLSIAGDPGVRDLNTDLAKLIKCFEASLHTAINTDGYPEEDSGYGTAVASWLALLAEMLRRAGLFDAYRECPRLVRFGQAMLHFVEPWGEDIANTGDHGDDFGLREFVLARLASETNDPTLLWLLGTLHYHHGKVHPENTLPDFYLEVPLRKGFRTHASFRSLLALDEMEGEVHPRKAKTPTQFRDRDRGIVSFRSGWDENDTFVVFDGSQRSPSAQGHFHDSCGDFLLSAVGEYFAIGTGRYNNEQDCHNVVLIDGKSGRSTNGEWRQSTYHGNLIDYVPGELCDFAAADSSHQHNCYWARRYLGLVKGKGARGYAWTVEDLNKANDWAEYWWQMQTSPENTITTRKSSATIKGWRHGNLLDVHFALPAKHEYPKPHTLTVTQDLAQASSHKYLQRPVEQSGPFPRPRGACETLPAARRYGARPGLRAAPPPGQGGGIQWPLHVRDDPAQKGREGAESLTPEEHRQFARGEDHVPRGRGHAHLRVRARPARSGRDRGSRSMVCRAPEPSNRRGTGLRAWARHKARRRWDSAACAGLRGSQAA